MPPHRGGPAILECEYGLLDSKKKKKKKNSYDSFEVLRVYDIHNFLGSVHTICFLENTSASAFEHLASTYTSIFP